MKKQSFIFRTTALYKISFFVSVTKAAMEFASACSTPPSVYNDNKKVDGRRKKSTKQKGNKGKNKYYTTCNPENDENTSLHVRRYRDNAPPETKMTAEKFKALHEKKSWEEDHIHLDNMDVIKFCIDTNVQRLLHELQTIVVDQPYKEWGRTTESWEGYTLLLRNGFQSGDRRKPVTDEFQAWFETVYCPIFLALLYGEGWDSFTTTFHNSKRAQLKFASLAKRSTEKMCFTCTLT